MIPYCILVIEDDDDRTFMEQLFVDYHRLMYHEIFKLVHDQWAAEDVICICFRKACVHHKNGGWARSCSWVL